MEKKNEIIIQKLSNILEELEFLNNGRSGKEKMDKEKSCNNCKYYKRTEKRNKHGKLIAFSIKCKTIKTCINNKYWERKEEK